MKNKITDLNNHLFEALERLGDEEITGDKLDEEINRSKAITGIAAQIIATGSLALRAASLAYETGDLVQIPLLQIEDGNESDVRKDA